MIESFDLYLSPLLSCQKKNSSWQDYNSPLKLHDFSFEKDLFRHYR